MLGSNAWLMLAGAGLVLAGILIHRWTARYDLKDAAIESVWALALGRSTAENATALEAKLRDIQSQPTWAGKAAKTAGTAIRHVLAQIMGVVGLVFIVAGLALAAAGLFWR